MVRMRTRKTELREKCTLQAQERAIRVAATEAGYYRTIDLARAAGVSYERLIRTLSGLRCGPLFAERVSKTLGQPVGELFVRAEVAR